VYAGSNIKNEMLKSHTFYHVQLNVLLHARRSYVSLTTIFHGSEASDTIYLRALMRSGVP